MEYALGEFIQKVECSCWKSLNPYYNGICSRSKYITVMKYKLESLNPYYNGICSRRTRQSSTCLQNMGLNPYYNGICSRSFSLSQSFVCKINVLILIIMEYALGVNKHLELWKHFYSSLNPYYNGICSRSGVH